MSDYDKQAEKFLKETGTEFKAEFFKNGLHLAGDTDARDIYKITLERTKKVPLTNLNYDECRTHTIKWSFNFGQSLINSEKNIKPTPYDVLSCLTTSNPETFKDFCGEFGYDEDSRNAEKIYKAVVEEWKQVKILWSDEEIERLQKIN